MFLTDTPAALPNCCIFCPGSVRRRYIDTTLQQEFYGAVFICEECVTSMAQMFGMATQGQVEVTLDDMRTHEDEIFELRRKLAAAEEAVRGLTGMLFADRDPGSPGEFRLDDRSVDEESPGGTDSLGTGAGTPPEPLHDEGVAVVSDDADSPQSFNLRL